MCSVYGISYLLASEQVLGYTVEMAGNPEQMQWRWNKGRPWRARLRTSLSLIVRESEEGDSNTCMDLLIK